MPKVFISYRRDDSQHQADRIFDALTRVVPKKDIFIDIDGIPAGVDFVDHLNQQVEKCDTLLALIGPEWLTTRSANGQRRLDDPGDFVRIEIAAALKRRITVAPVLLDGATMPLEKDLPPDIKELARRNAIEIRRNSFDSDAQRMMQKLGIRSGRGWALALVAGLAAAVGIGAWAMLTVSGGPAKPGEPSETVAEAALPAQVAPDPAGALQATVQTPPVIPAAQPEPANSTPAPAAAPKIEQPVVSCTDCPPLSRTKLPGGKTIEASAPISLGDWRLFCANVTCGDVDRKREAGLPVTSISWTMANQYVAWLSTRMGRALRLPTAEEAEGLTLEQPTADQSAYSEWTSTCHGSGPGACAGYEVRGWDAKAKRIADWFSLSAKGSTLGFRVVAAGKL